VGSPSIRQRSTTSSRLQPRVPTPPVLLCSMGLLVNRSWPPTTRSSIKLRLLRLTQQALLSQARRCSPSFSKFWLNVSAASLKNAVKWAWLVLVAPCVWWTLTVMGPSIRTSSLKHAKITVLICTPRISNHCSSHLISTSQGRFHTLNSFLWSLVQCPISVETSYWMLSNS